LADLGNVFDEVLASFDDPEQEPWITLRRIGIADLNGTAFTAEESGPKRRKALAGR
jgi:hypothetical protein